MKIEILFHYNIIIIPGFRKYLLRSTLYLSDLPTYVINGKNQCIGGTLGALHVRFSSNKGV